ncbi:lema family protein [Variovorax soli]|uniref:lema family protein n=1 Tax=Variovorax soli TaxID=376815 RepID=UPI000837F6B6|nr:lema family protein [Variovorax soli]
MSALPDSIYWWVGGALLLFWFVGANNRLMRLRSAALVAYAALDAALLKQLDYVQARTTRALVVSGVAKPDVDMESSLLSSVAQLSAMLAVTRLRPLEPSRVASLGTALHVMLNAWGRMYPGEVLHFDAEGTLSMPAPLNGELSRVPQVSPFAWPEPSAAAEIARGQFNDAVNAYNRAISQFPALIVAWAFRLRRASPLV